MITKQDLESYRDIRREVKLINEQLRDLQSWLADPSAKTTKTTQDLKPRNINYAHSAQEDAMAKEAGLEIKLAAKVSKALSLLSDIEIATSRLSAQEQVFIRLHYLQGKTMAETAAAAGYGERQAYRIRDNILAKICLPE